MRVARVRDDHPVDLELLDEVGQHLGRSQDVESSEVVTGFSRLSVEEADQPDRVLGMALELARDQLTHVSRSDDDRVLPEQRTTAGHRARKRSPSDDEPDRHQPEGQHARRIRPDRVRQRRESPEQPRADGDHREDPGDVVDGRVIRSPFVSAVEPAQLRHDHPEGQCERERQGLQPGRHEIRARSARLEEELGNEEREAEAENIGNEEDAMDEPSPFSSRFSPGPGSDPPGERECDAGLGRYRLVGAPKSMFRTLARVLTRVLCCGSSTH